MKVVDLFSGIGGFSLGLEAAGMETIAFCEQDSFCQKVLRKRWPDVPIHDDIRGFDGNEYRGTADVVCGGFPCQPFSQAGKRRGSDDDRYLWPEMLRVIREVQPRWVIGENVVGIIGMELDNCLSDLETLGYACGAFVIPACAVDAHHRRDRVWIVGDRYGEGESRQPVDAEAPIDSPDDPHRDSIGSHRTQLDVLGGAEPHDGEKRDTRPVREVLAGQGSPGFGPAGKHYQPPATWISEPGVGRVVDGVPSRAHRLRALGNAVVPQVVTQIAHAILTNAR